MKTLLILIFGVVVVYLGATLVFRFIVLGMKPWNNRVYSIPQIREMTRDEGLSTTCDCVLLDSSDLHSQDKDSSDTTRSFPQYRIFDASGHLLRQHCCFESIPGCLDSTLCSERNYKRDSWSSLAHYLSHLRRLDTGTEPQLDSLPPNSFVLLYYWDSTLEYNLKKFRTLLAHSQALKDRWTIIGVNCNRVSLVSELPMR